MPTRTHSQNSLVVVGPPSFKDPPMDRLSDDHKGHPNQHNNIHNLCNETGLPLLSLADSQGKLRQQHDQNFPMEGKPL